MTGYISPEGISLPAGGDFWDVVNAMRTAANSTRSVVSVADQTTGDAVATAMAADGRPVSDSNPLVAFRQDIAAICVKNSSGWNVPLLGPFTTANPSSNYTGSGYWWAQPVGRNYLITASCVVLNSSGATTNIPGGAVAYTTLGVIAPAAILALTGAGPMAVPITWSDFNAGNGANSQVELYYDTSLGKLLARGTTSTFSWVTGSQINFQLNYMI